MVNICADDITRLFAYSGIDVFLDVHYDLGGMWYICSRNIDLEMEYS